jgi:hypothetical protein
MPLALLAPVAEKLPVGGAVAMTSDFGALALGETLPAESVAVAVTA